MLHFYRFVVAYIFAFNVKEAMHLIATERIVASCDDDIEYFIEASNAKNTTRSTNVWVKARARERGIADAMESFAPDVLNKHLEELYIEVRQQNDEEYEPTCLNVMLAALGRYLKAANYP